MKRPMPDTTRPTTCWSCHQLICEEPAPVGFLGVTLCRRCEKKHREARNSIRLLEWEAAFKRLGRGR